MYDFTIFLLERGIALINLIAIYSFYKQISLVLSNGVTPGK